MAYSNASQGPTIPTQGISWTLGLEPNFDPGVDSTVDEAAGGTN